MYSLCSPSVLNRRPFLVCSRFVPIRVGGVWTPRAYGECVTHLICYIKKSGLPFPLPLGTTSLKPSVSSVQSEESSTRYPYTRLVPLQAVAYLESRIRGIPLTKKKASYRRPPHQTSPQTVERASRKTLLQNSLSPTLYHSSLSYSLSFFFILFSIYILRRYYNGKQTKCQ